jgi:ABC-type uncharacterized transport system permease subunit
MVLDLVAFFYRASLPFIVVGIVAFSAYSFWRRPGLFKFGTIATMIAFAGLTLELLAMLAHYGSAVMLATAARYLMAAWTIMVVYFVAEARYRIRLLGSILMPVALVLMLVAMFVDNAPTDPPPIAGLNTFLAIHVALIFASFSLIFLAFAAAILYLLKARALKGRTALAMDAALPALDTSRQLMNSVFKLAFPLLTLGLILGAAYAASHLHGDWFVEPKIVAGTVIWVTYAALFAGQHLGRLTPPGLARGVLMLFVIISLSFVWGSHGMIWKLLDRQASAPANLEQGPP